MVFAAEVLGRAATKLAINQSIIRHSRIGHRTANEPDIGLDESFIEDQLGACQGIALVVYWDRKILPDAIAGSEMVDRLPIYVAGTDISQKRDSAQLLGVPWLHRGGTDEAQAKAVVSTVQE